MANPNAIVDTVSQLDPAAGLYHAGAGKSAPGDVTVYFSGGQSARLSPSDARSSVYAEILDEMRQMGAPVYVEIDPANRDKINRLLIPLTVVVTALTPTASGDMEIELEISHARHVLKAANPDFGQLLDTLQESLARGTPVIVTETDIKHEIIDVRPAPDPFVLARARPSEIKFDLTLRSVTPQRATQLFNLVFARTCEPRTATPPSCIPFLYPDDGCWGRAHEMCRSMIGLGEQPGKVWVYGRLRVSTRNHPDCELPWDWHVAPTLEVSSGGSTSLHVIDPSLFTEHVPEAVWRAALGSITSTAHTDSRVFYRAPDGRIEIDPTHSKTDMVLHTYRIELKKRSVEQFGPPPYANCQ